MITFLKFLLVCGAVVWLAAMATFWGGGDL